MATILFFLVFMPFLNILDFFQTISIDKLNGTKLPSINIDGPNADEDRDKLQHSWIYSCCMRCRVPYDASSWEPPGWQRVCPYPLCPSYRQFSRLLSIILIGE